MTQHTFYDPISSREESILLHALQRRLDRCTYNAEVHSITDPQSAREVRRLESVGMFTLMKVTPDGLECWVITPAGTVMAERIKEERRKLIEPPERQKRHRHKIALKAMLWFRAVIGDGPGPMKQAPPPLADAEEALLNACSDYWEWMAGRKTLHGDE